MRRADRLFQIIQILRRSSRPVTAAEIARELEVTVRTVYRDMADLIGQRVPVRGEAGLGYIIDGDFDMPPLMLTPDEVEAAVLGAQMVAARGDPALAKAARDLIAKITAVVPDELRRVLAEPSISSVPSRQAQSDPIDLAVLRAAIREGRKMRIDYRDERGDASERVVWPVILGFFEAKKILAAWCELRQDFRHFRIDRVAGAQVLEARHGCRPGELRLRWKKHMTERPAPPARS